MTDLRYDVCRRRGVADERRGVQESIIVVEHRPRDAHRDVPALEHRFDPAGQTVKTGDFDGRISSVDTEIHARI